MTWSFFAAYVSCLPTVFAQGCNRGFGTSPPACSGNPVACAYATGNWADSTGGTWFVSSNTMPQYAGIYPVTGHQTTPNPNGGGCPDVTWSVSGNLTQSFGGNPSPTTFSWTASNPQPSGTCNRYTPVSSFTYSGNMYNNGCDTTSGNWTNSEGRSGTFTFQKPTDFPTGETSTAVAWWSGQPTVMLYDVTLTAPTGYMAGRQVYEVPGNTQSDSCWFQGSMIDQQVLGQTVQLAGWFVGYYYFNNRWEYDYVGPSTDFITYYRGQNKVPCEVQLDQEMNICGNNCLTPGNYFGDTLIWNIPDQVNVGVARANVQAWRTWP